MSLPQAAAAELAWAEQLPKVELHVHLEGSIPLAALQQLVQKYDGAEAPNAEELAARFRYRDFPHFIETWVWKNRYLRELADFTFISRAVAEHWRAQNIRYVEAFCSPVDFHSRGLPTLKLLAAIRQGLDSVPGIVVQLVVDLVRDFGPDQGARVLEECAHARELGVIGIGIGGSEQTFPPEPWAAVYARARQLGLHTSAHAGEAAGPASIWGALDTLRVERIGHGTRAFEDPSLVAALAERQVPLEMCPLSNLRTGVVKTLREHPIVDFHRRGLLVTVNTDDPAMFGNSLAQEYALLVSELGMQRSEVLQLIRNAVDASWMPAAEKTELHAELAARH